MIPLDHHDAFEKAAEVGMRSDWSVDKDGPRGTSTAYPSNLNVGASFDPAVAFYYAKAMSREFRDKGANMLLGPGVNLHRCPLGGRNFEYGAGYLFRVDRTSR